MTSAKYVQDGFRIDHVPSSDVPAGSVVAVNALFGVATQTIPANTKGSLQIAGVVSLPKPAGVNYSVGQILHWDPVAKVTTSRTDSAFSSLKVVKAASAEDLHVDVLLDPNHPVRPPLAFSLDNVSSTQSNFTTTNFGVNVSAAANSWQVGDVLRVFAQTLVPVATNATDTINFELRVAGQTVFQTGARDAAAGDIAIIMADMVMYGPLGSAATLHAAGMRAYGAPGTATFVADSNTKVISTTTTVTVEIVAVASAANANNQAQLRAFDVFWLSRRM